MRMGLFFFEMEEREVTREKNGEATQFLQFNDWLAPGRGMTKSRRRPSDEMPHLKARPPFVKGVIRSVLSCPPLAPTETAGEGGGCTAGGTPIFE